MGVELLTSELVAVDHPWAVALKLNLFKRTFWTLMINAEKISLLGFSSRVLSLHSGCHLNLCFLSSSHPKLYCQASIRWKISIVLPLQGSFSRIRTLLGRYKVFLKPCSRQIRTHELLSSGGSFYHCAANASLVLRQIKALSWFLSKASYQD